MPEVWYIAVEKFGPASGKQWADYVEWSGLHQLHELLSLDSILCPSIIKSLHEEDWQYNVQSDYLIDCFSNLGYLLGRVSDRSEYNLLALIREPMQEEVQNFRDDRFAFQGYDLIEQPGIGISALNNCGGFALAFRNTDISAVGLLDDYKFAREVQRRLREYYPDEVHANCNLWAIWKMKQDKREPFKLGD